MRLAPGIIVTVLFMLDHEYEHARDGEKVKEFSTEVLFIEMLNEIINVALSGSSWPVGPHETTLGMMNVLNCQEKSF